MLLRGSRNPLSDLVEVGVSKGWIHRIFGAVISKIGAADNEVSSEALTDLPAPYAPMQDPIPDGR